jgi:RND superfamily putative drug exporter
MHGRNLAARAGRWSAQHRRAAILGWLGAFVAGIVLLGAVGLNTIKPQDQGSGESRRADRLLASAGFFDRSTEQVLIQSRGRLTRRSRFRAAVDDVARTVAELDAVRHVKSPLRRANRGQVSRDRHSALVVFDVLGDRQQARERVGAVLDAIAALQNRHPGVRIEEFGGASADKALTKAFEDDFRKAETLSLPITFLILVAAFGSVVAAGLPVLLGLSAVTITLGLLGPISHLVAVDEAVRSIILLIGLAVGIDYSLFYLRRERDERRAGRDTDDALAVAAATSGRAVLISGGTVMIAMAGMELTGQTSFQSLGTGTILVVAVAMVGSVTVLPALLSKLGDNIDRWRIPRPGRRSRRGGEAGVWSWIVDRVLRRPLVSAIAAAALLVVLAVPALSMHTVNTGVNGLPRDLPIMRTYDRIQAAFPGGPLPALVVIGARDVRAPGVARGVRELRDRAVATGLLREPVTTTVAPNRRVEVVSIAVAGTGTDDTSERALAALRDRIVPATVGAIDGVAAPVTGLTAQSKDFSDLMRARAPWVFVFVLSLAFVLLLVTFRSIVIPVTAIALNLLSVGAAYGVLVWIFQRGHLEGPLGFTSLGGVTAWLPLFLFVILFGLSMDYHVFILTRVREAFDHGEPTAVAVRHGIRSTASVVTSAAIVMVAVFGVFATLGAIDFKQMGVGLAVAVLIDATVIRAVLLPATMKLLGDRNWYLPAWLEWLPRVERPPAPPRLRVVAAHRDGHVWVNLVGELDLATVAELRRQLAAIEADGVATVVLDLRALDFLDSIGIAELLAVQRRLRAAGRRLVLVKAASTPIAQILATAGVDAGLEVVSES